MDDIERVTVSNPSAHLSENEPCLGFVKVTPGVDVIE